MKNDAYESAAGPRSATATIPGTLMNHAGGAVFQVSDEARIRRFLMIGTVGGTYYQRESDYTRENLDAVRTFAIGQPERLAELIREVSIAGLAPKVTPQLVALALMTSLDSRMYAAAPTREAAWRIFPEVVRTGSHLLMWARYHKVFGGKIGRAWRRNVAMWYWNKDPDALAYQIAKYASRDGWSQKDLIDLSHALAGTKGSPAEGPYEEGTARWRNALRWARGEDISSTEPDGRGLLPDLIKARDALFSADHPEHILDLALDSGLSWEMLPSQMLRQKEVWEKLILKGNVPLTALIRNLPRLTELDVLDPYLTTPAAEKAMTLLGNRDALRKARIHPIQVLIAKKAYESSHTRSGLAYQPIPGIIDALEEAFYASFESAETSGKKHLVGVDVSASMSWGDTGGTGLAPVEIAAVIAMAIARNEPKSVILGFADQLRDLGITRVSTLREAVGRAQMANFGSTNPASLIEHALTRRLGTEVFVVVTDNEVNRGYHVPDLLRQYRRESGIDARLAVLAVTSTGFSIADASDAGMIDIVGFSSDVPQVLSAFARGF